MRFLAFRLALLSAFMACPACAHPAVVRDSATFATETAAGLAREEEAAAALRTAAEFAADHGDDAACRDWATTALLIDAKARAQAYRSLWLAGLAYPDASGVLPPKGTQQPDPGPGKAPEPPDAVCGPVPPVVGD